MSAEHLATGSTMPALKKGKLRLYSMLFCPYAQRTRLALAFKKVPYETVNINLVKKPEWYLELNPAGQVPCLQFDDGRTLPESLITAEYLDKAYDGEKLIPSDAYEAATHKLLIERFSKIITNYYKVLRSTDDSANQDYINALLEFQDKLKHDYLRGEKAGYADYMVWPWLERLAVIQTMKNVNFDAQKFAKLFAYIERMKQLPAVKECLLRTEDHMTFYKGYLSGNADYDFLLRKN